MRSIRKGYVLGLVFLLLGTVQAWGQSKPLIRFANEHWLTFILFDQLEMGPSFEGRPLAWNMDSWAGKVYNRIWIRSEGELRTDRREGEMEFQALYSRLISPYWDAQIGARMDVAFNETETRQRFHLAVGFEGLAPYWFELEPTLFLSQNGEISASLVASYDVFITQRLILQPELETFVAVQEVPDWGIGKGLNWVTLSWRLRYEIRREFAPYIGYQWHRFMGQTADLVQQEGESIRTSGFVFGIRVWY